MLYFSISAKAFYDDSINHEIPEDAIRITKEEHQELMSAINTGLAVALKTDDTVSIATDTCDNWDVGSQSWVLDNTEKQEEIRLQKAAQEDATLEAELHEAYQLELEQTTWKAVKANNSFTGKKLTKLNTKIK